MAASVGVAIAPARPPTPPRCSSAPTSPCTAPRRPPAGCGCTAPSWTPTRARPRARVGAADRHAAGPTTRAHAAPGATGAGRRRRRRGARALGHPVLGSIGARGVHPDRGAQRPDRPADHAGPRHALAGRAGWRAAGHDLAVAVNLSARSLRTPTSSRTSRAARPTRGPGRPADPRDHRELRHGRPRPRGGRAARPARARGAAVRRRLRHRLLVAVLPAAAAGPEIKIDKLRRRAALGHRERRDRAGHHRPGPQPRPRGRRRGRRGPGDLGPPATLGCDIVQGWHLARAMPIDDLLPWLVAREARRNRTPLGV